MPRKKARINYWVVDLKDFSFWFALAFVAGGGPNLAGAFSNWLLLGLWAFAALIALVIWRRNERRTGIGVYVHLPNPTDQAASDKDVTSIYSAMSRRHRDWFRSGPAPRDEEIDVRAERMLTTIEHRLDELELRDGQDPPVFLYVHARNEGAFLLGRKTAEHRLRPQERTPRTDDGSTSRLFFDFQVRTYSPSKTKEDGRIYELDLAKVNRQGHPNTNTRSLHAESHELTTPGQENAPPRLALIIHADENQNGLEIFRNRAVAAARAGAFTNGYRATEDDRCDNALFVSINAKEFYDRAQSSSAEHFVSALLDALNQASERFYGATGIPVRLFMRGPSILAFAAGAFLPKGSKYVPFDPNLVPPPVPDQSRNPDTELVAIIDGDDVGSETERHLLSGSLDKAIGHSNHITESIGRLTAGIDKIPGVNLISQGGDSAMFSLSSNEVGPLRATLDYLRTETNFKVSCGYGRDSKEAFLALRLAKSSGKNITLGHDQ